MTASTATKYINKQIIPQKEYEAEWQHYMN